MIEDVQVQVRLAVLEEHLRGIGVRDVDFRALVEWRLENLNGEASRLKTVLDKTVAAEVFNAYVSTQRDKVDAADRASREHFDTYVKAQAEAFKKYSEDVAVKIASINTQLARYAAGVTVVIAVIQLYLKYGAH